MSWQDRLTFFASYTPPGGAAIDFEYEDVGKKQKLRGTAFEFPDADGTFVQRTGVSGYRYPLRCIFQGDDHDLEARIFEEALRVPGTGVLQHPFYGQINVVPFGDVSTRDDLATAANQTIIEVTFWDTIDVIYPTAQSDPASSVVQGIGEYNFAKEIELPSLTDLSSVVEQETFKAQYEALLALASTGLQAIADAQEDVQDQFNAVHDSINASIDILVQEPATLAAQTLILLEAPARAQTLITDRLAAYRALANTLIVGDNAIQSPGLDSTNNNAFQAIDLYASTYVAGAVLSVVNNTFETRTDALSAAEFLLDFMSDVTAWRDANFESLGVTDTGGSYQQLQEAVSLAAGFLVEISFTLKQERRLVLVRDRCTVELVAELYGAVDEFLDFFADSNGLSWQEHLEIKAGREIVYYI